VLLATDRRQQRFPHSRHSPVRCQGSKPLPDFASLQGAADMDAALASNIMKKQRFRADDLNADDEYDFDRGIDMYERKRGDQVTYLIACVW
jgi:hypothetical protein